MKHGDFPRIANSQSLPEASEKFTDGERDFQVPAYKSHEKSP